MQTDIFTDQGMLSPEAEERLKSSLGEAKFPQYKERYRNGKDFRPMGTLSQRLCARAKRQVEASKEVVDLKKPEWKEMEMVRSAFGYKGDIDDSWRIEGDNPQRRDSYSRSEGTDLKRPTRVIIPATLAAGFTFCSNMMGVFNQDPLHGYQGYGTIKAIISAAKMERVVSRQTQWFGEPLALDTLLADGAYYGRGTAILQWKIDQAYKRETEELSEILAELLSQKGVMPKAKARDLVRYIHPDKTTVFEGSRLRNLDPWRTYPDPGVSGDDFYDSQFLWWQYETNAMVGLANEDADEDEMNWEYTRLLAHKGDAESVFWNDDESYRQARYNYNDSTPDKDVKDRAIITEGFGLIIPNEWQVGDGSSKDDKPQLYHIKISGDKVVNTCKPIELDHGFIPAVICQPINGRDILPTAYLAQTLGQQRLADFYSNSRMQNVAKCLNGITVYNGRYIDEDALLNPGPGKMVPLLQNAMLSPSISIDHYMKMFDVPDVTASHSKDIQETIGMLKMGLGQQDPLHGDLSGLPDKMGSQGASIAFQQSTGMMKYLASKIAVQTMQKLAFFHAYNTMQFMEEDQIVEIIGPQQKLLQQYCSMPESNQFMNVSKFDFDPAFQVVVRNGAIPHTENPNFWMTLVNTLLQVEGVAPDLVMKNGGSDFIISILAHAAKANGAETLPDFLKAGGADSIQQQVMPDQQVNDMQASGQISPMQGMAGMGLGG